MRFGSKVEFEHTLIAEALRHLGENRFKPLHWADFGGGCGVALSQYRCVIDPDASVITTNVNLEAHDADAELSMLAEMYGAYDHGRLEKTRKLFSDTYAPIFLQADMETVTLPEKADLITSVQSVQYADSLRTVVNMYRNLASGGIMAVMCEGGLGATMKYPYLPWKLMTDFTKVLRAAGVSHAYHGARGKLSHHGVYVIAKKPHTQMIQLIEAIPRRDQTSYPGQNARCTFYRRAKDTLPIAILPE